MSNVSNLNEPMLLSEYCARCREPIEVISPLWYRLDWDYVNKRIRWDYQPDDTTLCVHCCIAGAGESEREQWKVKLSQLLHRKAKAGLRRDVTMFHHRTNNSHVYSRVRGVFQMDHYFLHYRGLLPDNCALPHFTIKQQGQPMLTLLHVGWDFTLEGVPAVVRFTWDSTDIRREGELTIDGWSEATHPQLMRLMEGARALMKQQLGGRPRGTTDHTLEDYVNALHHIEEELGGPPKSMDQFLEFNGLSRDTFKRNLKRWDTTWSKFRKDQSSI